MRCAADGVAVLQATLVARRPVRCEIGAEARRDELLPAVRLDGEERLVKVVRVAVERDARHRGDARGELRQVRRAFEREAGQRRHHRRPVHDRQALLGAQANRLQAGLGERGGGRHPAARIHDVALTAHHRGHIRQRRQIATGAHRALGGNQRQDVVLEQRGELFEQPDADARVAAAQRREPRREHRARLRLVEECPQAAPVERIEVMRQLPNEVQRHRHGTRITVARGHAVDHAVFLQDPINEVGAALDERAELRIPGQRGAGPSVGQVDDVGDRQPLAVKAHDAWRGHVSGFRRPGWTEAQPRSHRS